MVSGWPDGWLCAFSGSHKAPPDMAVDPPMRPVFSISSTCKPAAAAVIAADMPPAPEPPTTPSYSCSSCTDRLPLMPPTAERPRAGAEAGLRRGKKGRGLRDALGPAGLAGGLQRQLRAQARGTECAQHRRGDQARRNGVDQDA